MRPQDVRDFVKREPFQPFRLTLSDGRTYDAVHPDLVMVGLGSVAIGVPKPGDADDIYDRMVTVSLYHIVQIEPIAKAATPTNGST